MSTRSDFLGSSNHILLYDQKWKVDRNEKHMAENGISNWGEERRRRRRTEIERKRAEGSRKWKEKLNLGPSIKKKKNNVLNSSGDLPWEPDRVLFLWLLPIAFISFYCYFYNMLGFRFRDKLESYKFWFTHFPRYSKRVCDIWKQEQCKGNSRFLNEEVWLWICSSRLFREMSETKNSSN